MPVPCSKFTNLASSRGTSKLYPNVSNGCLHIVPTNSEPLKVFKILNFSIEQDLTIESKRFLATIIIFSLKL